MKVLVIGSGAREHAFAWKLSQSKKVTRVFCAPGNPGMAAEGTLVPLAVDQVEELKDFALAESIDLTVVGPEYPLTLGVVDVFKAAGLKVFGPTKEAAQLEGSKAFAKELMDEAGILTAGYHRVETRDEAAKICEEMGVPVVLKADGLAAGKGVHVCTQPEEVTVALETLFDDAGKGIVVIEEFLEGKEVSYIVATDGSRIVPFASSHDYKRIFDGDKGPNTGGMGTVSPTPNLPQDKEAEVLSTVIEPVVKTMAARGTPFCGFIFAGLMVSPDNEIKVLEYNARCGDPETESLMMRLDSDFFDILYSLSGGEVEDAVEPSWSSEAAVTVVLASKGYPATSSKGDVIDGVEMANSIPGVKVFHAGTGLNDQGKLVTAGGRVLAVSARGETQASARATAYKAADLIQFVGRQIRRDIAS